MLGHCLGETFLNLGAYNRCRALQGARIQGIVYGLFQGARLQLLEHYQQCKTLLTKGALYKVCETLLNLE